MQWAVSRLPTHLLIFHIMKYILLLILFAVALSMSAQGTYFNRYHNFEDNDELAFQLFHIEGRNYMWGRVYDGTTNTFLVVTESNGDQVGAYVFDDAFWQDQSVIYDQDRDKFIVVVRTRNLITQRYGNKIMEISRAGELLSEVPIVLHDEEALWEYPYSIIKHGDTYVIGAKSYNTESNTMLRATATRVDTNFVKINSSLTNDYTYLQKLLVTNDNELYGIMNRKSIPGQSPGDQDLVRLNDNLQIDTLIHILPEGSQTGISEIQMVYDHYEDRFVYWHEFDSQHSRVVAINKNGDIQWERTHFNVKMHENKFAILLAKNGDVLFSGFAHDGFGMTVSPAWAIDLYRIDKDGKEVFGRYYSEFRSRSNQTHLSSSALAEDSNGNIIVLGRDVVGGSKRTITCLLKVNAAGQLYNQEGTRQHLDNIYPADYFVSERNTWHIYNGDTDEAYRYTFADTIGIQLPLDVGGAFSYPLLRSDSGSGNGNDWYEIGREFYGSTTQVRAYDTTCCYGHRSYEFSFEVGDKIQWDYFSNEDPNMYARLEVIATDSTTLLDGSRRKTMTLRCNTDPDGSIYGTRTWIDGIGDIDNMSRSHFTCREPIHEHITCFYSNGELLWVHPDFSDCIVNSTREVPLGQLVFPNPATDHIEIEGITSRPQDYTILDISGKRVAFGTIDDQGHISVAALPSGIYIIQLRDQQGKRSVSKFVKQ